MDPAGLAERVEHTGEIADERFEPVPRGRAVAAAVAPQVVHDHVDARAANAGPRVK